MNQSILTLLALMTLNLFGLELKKEIPQFDLISHEGRIVKLTDFKGKPIVLEWLNHDCPFVKKHYGSNNMQRTQKLATVSYTHLTLPTKA